MATWGSGAWADVTIAVDASADTHPISPLIYGVNFPTAAHLATKTITVMRRGGNATSRYNYVTDMHNTGADYYFENIPDCPGCANPKDSSSANAFLQQAATNGLVALFTMPTIGWMPKSGSATSHPYACGCPKTTTAQQECFDPYDTNCGDGRNLGDCSTHKGSVWITCAGPTATSEAADASFEKGWAAYIVGKFGASNGKRIYELDNEPALWSSTHYDVRPQRLGYDELWQRMRDYAVAIGEADPTAQFAGPVEWGWPNYLCSDLDDTSKGCSANSPDRKAHGGTELVAWLLDQAKAYEAANGRRILHYLDLHYYPQGGSVPDNTHSLWDPNYNDPSWINATIRLIPRMRDWVAGHYPGTKLSISEYDFYDHDSAIGAVTYAEVLGIFGREGLDMATAWGTPGATQRSFSAFKLFRNFDGAGGHFESTNARATVTGTGVQAFAASSATRLTIALANEGAAAATAIVSLAGFTPGATASVYSNDGTANIAKKPNLTVSGGKVSVPLGATTITLVVIDGANSNPPGTGGATGAGGVTGTGGVIGTGGTAAGTGGSAAGSGGTIGAGTGGTFATGTGGTIGAGTGGMIATGAGGTVVGGNAGASSGGNATASSSGGGTLGASSSGGSAVGLAGKGGSVGGGTAATSGSPGTAPDASTGADAPSSGNDGACGCRSASGPTNGAPISVFLAALSVAVLRRRRRGRRA